MRDRRKPKRGVANPTLQNEQSPAAGDLPHAVVDLTSPERSSAPALPHERDESVGTTGSAPNARVQQAFVDLEQGRQDTSRALESDEAYERQKKS